MERVVGRGGVRLSRCLTVRDLARSEDLYVSSFPAAERRSFLSRCRLLLSGRALYYSIEMEGRLVGLLHVWPLDDALFIEHFAILDDLRGVGVGGYVLDELLAVSGQPCLLEVDRPGSDAWSGRRIGFYERHGFRVVNREWVQPTYGGAGGREVPLYLMYSGEDPLACSPGGRLTARLLSEVYGVGQ